MEGQVVLRKARKSKHITRATIDTPALAHRAINHPEFSSTFLQTLLAIGGWNEGATKYSQMASDPAKRSGFIQSALDMVLTHNFDGLDLDWEYPGSLTSRLELRMIVVSLSDGLILLQCCRYP